MIERGYIAEIVDRYNYKVRIPFYNQTNNSFDATSTENLAIATVSTMPGCLPYYAVGDLVWLEFWHDLYTQPIIMGRIYTENNVVDSKLYLNENSVLTTDLNGEVNGLASEIEIVKKRFDISDLKSDDQENSKMNKVNPEGIGSFSMNRLGNMVGDYSTTLGQFCSAMGDYSFSLGENTVAASRSLFVIGTNNIEDTSGTSETKGNSAFIIGNGNDLNPSNAHVIDWDGSAWFNGDVYTKSTSGTHKDSGSYKLESTVNKVKTIGDLSTNDLYPSAKSVKDYVLSYVSSLLPTYMQTYVLDKVYPIGSIYLTFHDKNPGEYLGGNWEKIQDRFLLGASSTYPLGTLDGEATVTLTENQIPSHVHEEQLHVLNKGTVTMRGGSATGETTFEISSDGGRGTNGTGETVTTKITGGGQSHNNMPPYIAVYMWKRIEDKE